MTDQSQKRAVQAVVAGRVQGVGFRQFVQRAAQELNVTGWVSNREDGSTVELQAEGREADLLRLIELVRTGPAGARVDEIDVEWITPPGQTGPFQIRT